MSTARPLAGKQEDLPRWLAQANNVAHSRGGQILTLNAAGSGTKLLWQCAEGHRWEAKVNDIRQGSWCAVCAGRGPKTIEDMRILAREQGGQCLSTDYVNVATPLRWRCAEGHEWLAKPSNVRRTWCPACARCQKLTLRELYQLARSRGGELLSSKYVNNTTPLIWKCGAGHVWWAKAANVKGTKYRPGTWCPDCRGGWEAKRLGIEDMRELAASRGGECLSEQYSGPRVKLEWRCGKGHVWMARPGYVKHGTWCPLCSGRAKLTLEQLRQNAADRGGKCLATVYLSSSTPVTWECAQGHRWDATPGDVRLGSWCPMCARKARLTIEEMQELARARGGECLSKEYTNSKTPLIWRCAEGHIWRAQPSMVKPSRYGSGTWCPVCARRFRQPSAIVISELTTNNDEA